MCSYWHSSRYHPLNDSTGPILDGAAPPPQTTLALGPWPLALGPWPLALGPGPWPTPQARVGLNEGCLRMFMHVQPRAIMFVHEDARVGLNEGCLKMFTHVHPRASMYVHDRSYPLALAPGPWP